MENRNQQPILVMQSKGNTDLGTILAVGAGALGLGFGAWYLLTRKGNPEFELIQPTAAPGVIAVGAQTTVSAGVKNVSKSEQVVDVRLQIFQAGFLELMGPQIDEDTTHLTIAPGATGYGTIVHTGSIGGPTSNGVAMRHVIISTLVDGKVIGTPWTAKKVFGVTVEGETVSFTVGQPVVNNVSYPNAKVLSGDTTPIKIRVSNTGSQPQIISLHASVHEHSEVGTGDAIGTPYTSSSTTIASGKSVEFSFTHVAEGTSPNSRDIVTSVYQGSELAPNTGPNNPNIFRNAFSVVATPTGVSFTYGTLTVHTPSGTLQEPEDSPVIFHVEITNTGTRSGYVDAYLRIREESLIGTGAWASDEIECSLPRNVAAKETVIFAFPWLVAGAVGRKTAVLYLKNENGALMDQHNYGGYGNPVIELIVPTMLYININPAGAGTVNVQRGDGSTAYDVSSLAVRKDEPVVLRIGSGDFNASSYWSGDTGLNADLYGLTELAVTMDVDRVITANFVTGPIPPPPPTTVSISMHLDYWPSGAVDWRLEHFNPDGTMDFVSDFVDTRATIQALDIDPNGNFGVVCRDADGTWIVPTIYSERGAITLIDLNSYVFWYANGTIHVWY